MYEDILSNPMLLAILEQEEVPSQCKFPGYVYVELVIWYLKWTEIKSYFHQRELYPPLDQFCGQVEIGKVGIAIGRHRFDIGFEVET